jgi:hypothetical protein
MLLAIDTWEHRVVGATVSQGAASVDPLPHKAISSKQCRPFLYSG